MANETSYSVTLSASKGGASVSLSNNETLDMTGTEMASLVQNFSTTGAAITMGGVDQAEVLGIKNMDPTNSLTIGLTNGNPPTNVISVIKPGGAVLLTGVSTTLYAASSAATVDAFIAVVET